MNHLKDTRNKLSLNPNFSGGAFRYSYIDKFQVSIRIYITDK